MRLARALGLCLVCLSSVAKADGAADVERLSLDATRGIVPQAPRAADLFRHAHPAEGDAFTGMLLCEIRVEGDHWDGGDPLGPVRRFMGRAEIDAEVTLPGRDDRTRFRGPDDTNRVVMSVPGVRLSVGDALSFELADRDVFSNDTIGTLTLTYDGQGPLAASDEHVAVECRATPTNTLGAKIVDAVEAADDAIDDLERGSAPDPSLVGFRDSDADPSRAWRAVFDLAAWTGLADPRFLARRDLLRTREVAHVDATAALVTSLVAGAPRTNAPIPVEGTQVSFAIEEYDCQLGDMLELHPALGLDIPMECALRVTVRNDDDRDATLSVTLHTVDELGVTDPLPRAGLVQGGSVVRMRTLRFAPGESRIILPAATRHAVLLRIGRRRGVQWLAVPAARDDAAAAGLATTLAPIEAR